jgi:magnesium-transporting ATPase (P-type)
MIIDAIDNNDEDVYHLCHTVMSEERNGKIIYQAQSPDENALVSASRSFGFAFQVKISNFIWIN